MKLSYKQRITNLLSFPDYSPLKANEIVLKLGLGKDERKKIKNILKKMTVAKQIIKLKGGGYILNNKKKKVKDNTKSAVKLNSKGNSWLIGKILKKNNKYFFEPRGDNLPTIEVSNTKNQRLNNGSLVLLKIDPKSKKSSVEKVLGMSGEINSE